MIVRGIVFVVLTVAAGLQAPASTAPAPAAKPNACERLVASLLPPEKINEMVGFFAPVAKKYLPEFDRFSRDYQLSTNKLSTVAAYLPVADKALAEAKEMRVSARFEQQKANYLKLLRAVLVSARLTTRLGGVSESRPVP